MLLSKKTDWFEKRPDSEIKDYDIEEHCFDMISNSAFEENGFDIIYGEGINGVVIGIILATMSSDCGGEIPDSEYKFFEMQDTLMNIKRKLKISDDIEPTIYTGTQSC